MTESVQAHRRTFAGWPLRAIAASALLIAAGCWMIWATRTLLDLRSRHVVSVSLAALVQDFVAQESRNGRTGEESAARTRAYLASVEHEVAALGQDGTIVLVSEATLGRSVLDRTAEVRARVEQGRRMSDALR